MREKQRRWRRILIGLVAAVVLGIATTIGVAWAEALREPADDAVYAHWGGFKRPSIKANPQYNWPEGPPPGAQLREMTIWTIEVFGWPRPALSRSIEWSYLLSVQHSWEGVTGYRVEHGFETPLTIGTLVTPEGSRPLRRVLPGRVMWRGFAIDTALFASGWMILFAVCALPGAMRRRHRARRGLCAGCGYDLRHSADFCPECGRAIDTTSGAGRRSSDPSAPSR